MFVFPFTISLIYMPKSRQSKKGILETSSIESIADYIKGNDGNVEINVLERNWIESLFSHL